MRWACSMYSLDQQSSFLPPQAIGVWETRILSHRCRMMNRSDDDASAKPKAHSFRTWQRLLFFMAPWYIFLSHRWMKLMPSSRDFTRTQLSNGNIIPPPEIQVSKIGGDMKHSWKNEDTKVLKSISLPRAESHEDIAQDDLLGDIWLPPRLPIADEIRTLEYGMLFCGVGSLSYAKTQMVPMISHLRDNLGIPDAHVRSSLRKNGIYNEISKMGFALVTTKEFVDGPLKDQTGFFDAVYMVEDLPPYPHNWQTQTSLTDAEKGTIKGIKVHVMSSAPFDRTIMLDFDSFPCHARFAEPLLEAFNKGDADIGFTNRNPRTMDNIPDNRHFLAEHNSAIVMLNMTSTRTRVLLALYIQAFHRASSEAGGGKKQRDQPSLMVAMQAMAETFHPQGKLALSEVPNDSVREVIEQYKLGYIRHVDFDTSLVCRNRTSKNVCSVDSSCAIAHKAQSLFKPRATTTKESPQKKVMEVGSEQNMTPIKIFGVGFKKTGTTSLDSMYSHLIDVLGGTRPSGRERSSATSDMIKGNEASTLLLAEKHHYFQDSPWCHAPKKLYQRLARLYPTSKFVLTTRDTDEWYSSVERWVKCVPGKKTKLCGKKKMEKYRAIFGANSTSREDFTSAFESHNSDVRHFFNEELNQPDRLLEIDLTNKDYGNGVGWKIFCEFVGISKEHCPSGDIPHENKTPSPISSMEYDLDRQFSSDSDIPESDDNVERNIESCLRPRSRHMDATPLRPPFINLGMPKMGTTSLHTYFDCGGYKSIHKRFGRRSFCGECIKAAIDANLPPLSKCNMTDFDSFTQIDKGPENLVQVNYLNEIVSGVPKATFILTFRNMTNWYKSLTNWYLPKRGKENNLRKRFERANITGLPEGVGRNVSEFSRFYCEHVKRVREEVAKYPGRHELIEIDIEDPAVGWQMEEAFGIDRTCWGKQNTARHNDLVTVDELQR